MAGERTSDCFKYYLWFMKIFGIWPGRKSSKYYKYYSILYVFIVLITYFALLDLNLFFTPRKVELFIREVTYVFTIFAVGVKSFMVLCKRPQILKAFEYIDSRTFNGDSDEVIQNIIRNAVKKYLFYSKIYVTIPHISYVTLMFVPVITHLAIGKEIELPISQYYFLSDKLRTDYFAFWYIYQAFPMYSIMVTNIGSDTFMAGLMFMATIQIRVLNYKLTKIKLNSNEKKIPKLTQDKILLYKLTDCLRHYDLILEYCAIVQKIISMSMFFMFGVASLVVCISICGLFFLPMTAEAKIFMVGYTFVMIAQLFIPARLGSDLNSENQKLIFAAVRTDWTGRAKQFSTNLLLFMTRANTPILFTGMNFFPLILSTFLSIMKMAYSFLTLIRNVQNRQT